MGTGCGLKILSKIELSCRLNLSWPCRSALFTNYGHVFVVTQSPTSESSLPLSRPTLPSPTCYLYMHAVPPIIWSCLRAVPSWTCRLYGRGLCVYVVYYLPAPYFLSQLECSLLEHEFEEETCGGDVLFIICVSGQPRRMEGIMVTTVRDFNILGSACR